MYSSKDIHANFSFTINKNNTSQLTHNADFIFLLVEFLEDL